MDAMRLQRKRLDDGTGKLGGRVGSDRNLDCQIPIAVTKGHAHGRRIKAIVIARQQGLAVGKKVNPDGSTAGGGRLQGNRIAVSGCTVDKGRTTRLTDQDTAGIVICHSDF